MSTWSTTLKRELTDPCPSLTGALACSPLDGSLLGAWGIYREGTAVERKRLGWAVTKQPKVVVWGHAQVPVLRSKCAPQLLVTDDFGVFETENVVIVVFSNEFGMSDAAIAVLTRFGRHVAAQRASPTRVPEPCTDDFLAMLAHQKKAIAAPSAKVRVATVHTSPVAVMCAGCGGMIQGESHVQTGSGKTYHEACLVCMACQTPISGGFGVEEDGPRCNACQSRCAVCSIVLEGEYLALQDGRSVHHACAPSTPCNTCRQPIMATQARLTVGPKSFHQGCLACETCKTKIDEYADLPGDVVVCIPCANKSLGREDGEDPFETCDQCLGRIEAGKAFSRCLGKKFHSPACFVCRACNTPLDVNGDIYDVDGWPTCTSCGST